MALTSLFGTANSKYGNLLYGEWAISALPPAAFPVKKFTSLLGSTYSEFGNVMLAQDYPNFYVGSLTSLWGNPGSWYGNEIYGGTDLSAPITITVSLTSDLALTETVVPGAILLRSPANALVLTEFVVLTFPNVFSDLTFTQTVSLAGSIWHRALISPLTMAGIVEPSAELNRQSSNALVLVETVTPDAILYRTSSSALALTSVGAPGTILHRAVSNAVVFAEIALREQLEDISSDLALTQEATYQRVLSCLATNQCLFVGNAFCGGTYNLSVANELLFAQYRYFPTGLGTYLTVPAVVVSVLPAAYSGSVIIQSATSVIVMPDPLLGDTEEQLSSLKINYSINGNSKITIKNSSLSKLNYTWELRRMKALELRQFLMNNDAVVLTMTNWKGEIWYCHIVNAPINLIAKSRWGETIACGGNEAIQVTLEFEGVKIGG